MKYGKNSKAKHGIAELRDNFNDIYSLASNAIKVNDQKNFLKYSLESIKEAAAELDALRSLENYEASQINYEKKHRESFIESKLAELKYLQQTDQLGDVSKGKLGASMRDCLSGYECSDKLYMILRLALATAKKRVNSKDRCALSIALKNNENKLVECKKSFAEKEPITKTVSAFANTRGGVIYIGIAESRDIKESDHAKHIINDFYAVGLPKEIDINRQKIISYIKNHSDIDISRLKITIISFKTKTIMSINVPQIYKTTGILTFFDEDAYMRLDNYTQKLTAKQVNDLVVNSCASKRPIMIKKNRSIIITK